MKAADIFNELTRLGALGPQTSQGAAPQSIARAMAAVRQESSPSKDLRMAQLCERAIGAVDSMTASQEVLRHSLAEMLEVWRDSCPPPEEPIESEQVTVNVTEEEEEEPNVQLQA